MSSKQSKSERKDDKIQMLERELSETKKKLKTQSKTIILDQEQLDDFLEQLTERIVWSTNRIVDESTPCSMPAETSKQSDGISLFFKLAIGIPIIFFGLLVFYLIFKNGNLYWVQGNIHKIAIVIMWILGLDCVGLGIEVLREKDRNYIVALFSALVSLVALIVAFVK
ncbi:MAG: hypothetical protein IKK09_09450 [Clostridia bacterium]|nr:hypothetical protein [Clostridia bacterium]